MIIIRICHHCKHINPPKSVIDIDGAIRMPNANCLKQERNSDGELYVVMNRYTHKCDKFEGVSNE